MDLSERPDIVYKIVIEEPKESDKKSYSADKKKVYGVVKDRNLKDSVVSNSLVQDSPVQDNALFFKFLFFTGIVGFLGSLNVNRSVKTEYYETLKKPSWSPKPRIISFVWILLYILMAYATSLAYNKAKDKNMLLFIYSLQLFINWSWTYLFFELKNPKAAFLSINLLILTTVIQAIYMYHIDITASLIFLVYIAWLIFAMYLNYNIIELNKL